MCYYDQYIFTCTCHKWGYFRQHCTKEYRTGEVCGMKLIMDTYNLDEKCKHCQKLDIKYNKIRKEEERIRRWRREHGRKASIEASQDLIAKTEREIADLTKVRDQASITL